MTAKYPLVLNTAKTGLEEVQVGDNLIVDPVKVILSGGTTGAIAGIGAAFAALTPRPQGLLVAIFADATYMKSAGDGTQDTDWTPMGSATDEINLGNY
jgi:energy-converting hydrogenase Eha subunit G